jgi:hypothetical protein
MNNVLALVLAGHLIGDWIVQTDWQAANKIRPDYTGWHTSRWVLPGVLYHRPGYWRSWRANQQHMVGYHLAMLVALLPSGTALTGWYLCRLVGVSWVTHSLIDRRWPVKWLMSHTGSTPFSETTFGVIAVDQALHLSILCLLVAWR